MKLLHFCLPALLYAAITPAASAGSASWATNPSSSDWTTASNWMPGTVPNSPTDIATFGASSITTPTVANTTIDLDSAVFNSGAPPYTITLQTTVNFAVALLNLRGAGVINNSGVLQSFVFPSIPLSPAAVEFFNSASAGEMTTYSIATPGGFDFHDSSSAGSAIFNLIGGTEAGPTAMGFGAGTTAANATINASGGAYIIFNPGARGGHATFNLAAPGFSYLQFGDSNAEHVNVNCIGAYGVLILGTSSAGDGTYTVDPGDTTTQTANTIYFADSATAGDATFILDGSIGAGFLSATLLITDTATAGNAKVIAYGGKNGGPGAAIQFHNRTDGGTATFTLLGNSTLDIGKHMAEPLTLGSLSGSGTVYLGSRTLVLGSNNESTIFSGAIQDSGGISQNTGGSLSKAGTGTLSLTGTNFYTGGTTVSAGVLRAVNVGGSATGPGAVQVNAGALGGTGIIAGAVTVGTGSGSGATLAPSVGSKQPLTLSLNSLLTLQGDSTYTCQLSTQKAQADAVIAQGVTLASGAQFNLQAVGNKRLSPGVAFTLISNTAATPINGTFANLANGSTLTAGRNKLLVSYTGGDGNDLTLTVQ